MPQLSGSAARARTATDARISADARIPAERKDTRVNILSIRRKR